jgi:hypothetical protein
MANRLIRYDAALLRRFLADNFGGPRDLLLLALVATLGVAWLRQQTLAAPTDAVWAALLAGPAGFALQRMGRQRLGALGEHSPVAPAALDGRERRTWFILAHFLLWLPLLAAASLLGAATGRLWAAVALAAASYAAGAGLAMILPALRGRRGEGWSRPSVAPLGHGRRAVLEMVVARQTLGTARPLVRAGVLLLGSFLLTVAANWWGRGVPVPLAFIPLLLPSLIVLLLAARLDAALLAFLPAAGHRPGFIALAVSALPAGSLLAGSAALLVTKQGIGIVIVLALAHLAFILIAIARAWLYPGRTRQSVDFQLQLEVAGLVAAAILLPPLALAAAGWRFWHFHRHCRAKRWMPA